MASSRELILERIRRSLGRSPGDALAARPAIVAARQPGELQAEIDRLLLEINALSGSACRLDEASLDQQLQQLVQAYDIRRAVLWPTPLLARLQLEARLRHLGVELIPATAGKRLMATCDLGVTEADYALPETGTLGLLSSSEKPRAISLLPRVHLAIVQPAALCPDLHQVFSTAKRYNYLILITGPSRTADIELTVTLGVHGPKSLVVWVLE